jgi:hypothetical protein
LQGQDPIRILPEILRKAEKSEEKKNYKIIRKLRI